MRLEDLGDRKDLIPQKSSLEVPPTLELQPLPPHLKYVYLGENNRLPVIISSSLTDMMEDKLLKVLKVHKNAFAWKVADIKGINPSVCMHKILMKEKHSSLVQPQRRLNPKKQEIVKAETIKLLDAGIIYPISDSAWVSHVQCVRKKGGITVITNEKNELIPTRTVMGWRAYEELKERLVMAPVLVASDWDLPFEVMCDASDTAVGAVLGQRQNKVFHTIYYASKTLDEAQLNYATIEKELLAVVFALDKFHSYLFL
ncbi:uncharacterized protein LOC142523803 [Primulina tabacum]|uniref:uncharacterized protein LOC142523803 n=1 Tax=Primulina tabacum TaxID=48773 RepID=UPI003F5A453B